MSLSYCQKHEATQAVQTLAEVAASHQDGVGVTPVSVEMADGTATVTALTGASIGQNGQIILTGDGAIGGLSGLWLSCLGVGGERIQYVY